jgi:hypothetical protein
MQDQNRLALHALHRHEPHRRPPHRFAHPFGIAPIVLVALHVRLHIGRRHQPSLVPELLNNPTPVMRATARLHPHHARRQLGKKLLHLPALQLTPHHDLPRGIHAVNLEHVLR